jgi:hypothetical protein
MLYIADGAEKPKRLRPILVGTPRCGVRRAAIQPVHPSADGAARRPCQQSATKTERQLFRFGFEVMGDDEKLNTRARGEPAWASQKVVVGNGVRRCNLGVHAPKTAVGRTWAE